tara:strand:+ start:35 stop:715 length:681 start_codon:yes stop_codon:yes gene_type:complete
MKDRSVIILCGGKGMRLRPLTDKIPKPLVEINNAPILSYIIKHLQKYNFNKYIIATGYKSEKISSFMSENFSNINYTIIDSGDTDILTRVKDGMNQISGTFMLCYGDTISDINIDDLYNFHEKKNDMITISSYPINIPFGVMKLGSHGIVEEFTEKPTLDAVINIGYYLFNTSHRKLINSKENIIELISTLIQDKNLQCYQHKGVHITINTLSELDNANENIKKIS